MAKKLLIGKEQKKKAWGEGVCICKVTTGKKKRKRAEQKKKRQNTRGQGGEEG
jgi:hypothetical protein